MIEAWTDGSLSAKGEMGVGCFIMVDGVVTVSVSSFLGKNGGEASGNYAEYAAVWELLQELKELPPGPVLLRADSMLVVKQLKGAWDIGNGTYAPMAHKVHEEWAKIGREVLVDWVPRKENMEADRLSKEAHLHKGRCRYKP